MKTCFQFSALLLCFITQSSVASFSPTQINEKIDNLFPTAHVGLVIKNLKNNQIIYNRQADKYFTPASTIKLFTSYAALTYLGQDYTFKTTLKFDPKKINSHGRLKSDVVLSFSGDPSFTNKQLIELLLPLKEHGITGIDGKIIIENDLFSRLAISPGATWDTWSYYPPVSPIVINGNLASINIQPNTVINQPCLASPIENPAQTISHDIITVTPEQAQQDCELEVDVSRHNHIHLAGCWPINKPNTLLQISIVSPERFLTSKIQSQLNSLSILYPKSLIYFTESTPIQDLPTAKLSPNHQALPIIKTIFSPVLTELLKATLQDSDNLYADLIHKTLGKHYFAKGTYLNGSKAQNAILAPIFATQAFDFNIKQYDGSGVSRYNLVTPNQFVSLLTVMYQDKKNIDFIINNLPIAGKAGTLKNRFKAPHTKATQSKIWAKTGSLKTLSSLVGYLAPSSDQYYAFALMIQGEKNPMRIIKGKEDELLAVISDALELEKTLPI